MTVLSATVITESSIGERRSLMRVDDPPNDSLLLNLLAVQTKQERIWREMDAIAFHGMFEQCLELGQTLNQALQAAIDTVIEQICDHIGDYRGRTCPLVLGLIMISNAAVSLAQDDVLILSHAAYVYDLLRYGAAHQDWTVCKDLCRYIKRRRVLEHPVRQQHPHGVAIIA